MSTVNQPVCPKVLNEKMQLVRLIVAQFVRKVPSSVQRDDLVSAGTLGLFRALSTSGHAVETMPEAFTAYAKIRIRGAIIDELRRHDWSPRRRRPAANVRPSQVPPPVNVVGFDDLAPDVSSNLMSDPRSPEVELESAMTSAKLHAQVNALPEREQAIIKMRYFDEISSKDVANHLGISEARVSQLHARATKMLLEGFDQAA